MCVGDCVHGWVWVLEGKPTNSLLLRHTWRSHSYASTFISFYCPCTIFYGSSFHTLNYKTLYAASICHTHYTLLRCAEPSADLWIHHLKSRSILQWMEINHWLETSNCRQCLWVNSGFSQSRYLIRIGLNSAYRILRTI